MAAQGFYPRLDQGACVETVIGDDSGLFGDDTWLADRNILLGHGW